MNENASMPKTISSTTTMATTTASTNAIHSRRRIAQNFLLIWVDANMDESREDCQNTMAALQSIVNDVTIFTKPDEAVDFLTEVHGLKTFLILEGSIGQHIVPLIHDIPQLEAIYIFSCSDSPHEQWTNEYTKIKGVHTAIKPICEALQLAAKQCNQDSIAVSLVSVSEITSSQNLDQLEPSFMYTQIFKEILFEMKHNEQFIKDLVLLWRLNYNKNIIKQKDINEFERDYRPQSAITWYTRECFVYEMFNRALRNLEGDTIINMGFFIHDLHQQIQELHQNQVSTYYGKSFTVYQGQGLLKTDFEKLLEAKGGLMFFNNFLSTSTKREVSLDFAEGASTNTNMVGILFNMTIDPSISSAPFASIKDVSFFQTEEEILFSMHTIFRIVEIKKINNNHLLYQADLQLTADDDQQLHTLTQRIRKEVQGKTAWYRLANLLAKLNQFDKAEELCNVLLEQTSDEGKKAVYYINLGYIKDSQGDYKKAIEYYEKGLEIQKKIPPPNHLSLATSYNNIGAVYKNMGEYSRALSFYEKALEIRQKTLPPNHPDLAMSYNNISAVYYHTGEYSKALSFYEKALEIRQKTLPPNHPDLATSYNNIGTVYYHTGEYWTALSFYEKAVEILQKTLPRNHPDLAISYNNIGAVYINMREYSKAVSFYEKALEILQKSLSPNHPSLATSYNNIGGVYYKMGEYLKALSYFERAQKIFQSSLPANHPNIKIVQEHRTFKKKS